MAHNLKFNLGDVVETNRELKNVRRHGGDRTMHVAAGARGQVMNIDHDLELGETTVSIELLGSNPHVELVLWEVPPDAIRKISSA